MHVASLFILSRATEKVRPRVCRKHAWEGAECRLAGELVTIGCNPLFLAMFYEGVAIRKSILETQFFYILCCEHQ
jgi:hypothetical protein